MEHQPSRSRGTVIVPLHEAMPALVALEVEGAVTETCPDMAGEQLDGADHQSGLAAYVSGLGGARQDIMLVLQEGGENAPLYWKLVIALKYQPRNFTVPILKPYDHCGIEV